MRDSAQNSVNIGSYSCLLNACSTVIHHMAFELQSTQPNVFVCQQHVRYSASSHDRKARL